MPNINTLSFGQCEKARTLLALAWHFSGKPLTNFFLPGLLLFFFNQRLPAQNWQWVQEIQATGGLEAKTTGLDAKGNRYLAGVFGGEVDFGNGTQLHSLYGEAFLAKFSPCGQALWAVKFAYSNDNAGYHNLDLAFDSKQNVVVALTRSVEACLLQYDKNGHLLHTVLASTPPQGLFVSVFSSAKAVDIDADDNIVVVGKFKGVTTLGGKTLDSGNHADLFIAKFSPDLQLLWMTNAGSGAKIDAAWDVALDHSGNAYVTGWLNQVNTLGYYKGDIYVNKYSPAGSLLWSRVTGGGSGSYTEHHIILDQAQKNCFAYGGLKKTAVFGTSTLQVQSDDLWNPYDLYFARLNTEGEWASAQVLATHKPVNILKNGLFPTSAAWDDHENLHISGYYKAQATFGNQFALEAVGLEDLFHMALSKDGSTQSVENIGSVRPEEQGAYLAASPGKLLMTGTLYGPARIDNITLPGDSLGAAFWVGKGLGLLHPLAIAGDSVICQNQPVVLSVPGDWESIAWSSGETMPEIAVANPGLYSVTTTAPGCPPLHDAIQVEAFSAIATIGAVGETLTATPPGTAYRWFLDEQLIPGATSQSIVPERTGHYSVEITFPNGCTALSDTILAFGGQPGLYGWKLFPNPTGEALHAEFHLNRPQQVQIEVFSMLGQRIHGPEIIDHVQDGTWDFPVQHLGSAMYFVRLRFARQCFVKPFEVVH